jgi:alkane 1-monooxygenase
MPASSFIAFGLLAIVPLEYHWTAISAWLSIPAFLVIFVTLDHVLGVGCHNQTTARRSLAFRVPIWLYVPAQLLVIVWGLFATSESASITGMVGLAVATGVTSGVFGMLVAHELIHSRHRGERALGLIMLAAMNYMHFRISHIYFHHRLAATYRDPATARLGENAYRFIMRSVVGQLIDAWCYEHARAMRRGNRVLGNRVHQYLAITVAIYAIIAADFGWRGATFFLIESGVAIVVLELFNYVAHYGMARRRLADGTLEPPGPHHSWNAAQRFNNWALFNAGHHTHHHRAPTQPYQTMTPAPAAPQLPTGLAGSILLALVPPLWRRVMDPKITSVAIPAQAVCGRGRLPPSAEAKLRSVHLEIEVDEASVRQPGGGADLAEFAGDLAPGGAGILSDVDLAEQGERDDAVGVGGMRGKAP